MKAWNWLKAHRRPFIAAGLFAAGLCVFLALWWLQVAEARQKGVSQVLSDEMSAATAPVGDGVIRQRMVYEEPVYAIGLVPSYEGRMEGEMTLRVLAADGALLAEVKGGVYTSLPGGWAVFVMPQKLQQADGIYDLEFTAQLENPGDELALYTSADAFEGWELEDAGGPQQGMLCTLVVNAQAGGFLTVFYWVFALAASCVAPGLYLLLSKKKPIALHRLFLVAVLALNVLYCFILPPYSSPDEQFHINQAFNQSSKLMGAPRELFDDGTNVKRADDHNSVIQERRTTVFSYKQLADNFFTLSRDDTPTVYEGEQVGGVETLYWPAMLAVTLGRLLHMGFVPVLYLGRLANILCAAALMCLAVKFTPVGKGVFCVLGLLPMTLHLTASFNRDAMIIGLFFFFTGYLLYLMLEKKKLDIKDAVVLGVVMLFAAPAKSVVYLPVLAMAVLVPFEKLVLRGRALPKWAVWLCRGVVVALCLSSVFSYAPNVVSTVGYEEAPQPGVAADSITFNLGYILQHPGRTVWVALNTLFRNGTYYWQTMLGGKLGYFDIDISWFFVLAFTVLLLAAALPEKQQPRLGNGRWAFGSLAFLAAAGLVVAGCFMWTPTYYETIYGIQGRYFIPLMPLGLVCLQNRMKALQKTRDINGALVACGATLSSFALLNAFLVILSR